MYITTLYIHKDTKQLIIPAFLHHLLLCKSLVLFFFFFFSSRRRHTIFDCDWSSDVCSSDLGRRRIFDAPAVLERTARGVDLRPLDRRVGHECGGKSDRLRVVEGPAAVDRSEEGRVGEECRTRWAPDY